MPEEDRRTVTPERWQYVKSVLGEILDLPPDARALEVDRVAADDPQLRAELESLLASYDEAAAAELLEQPAALALDAPDPLVGQRLGAYLIVSQIGTGGMGEVFRAVRDDDEYRQEVAIKLIRAAARSAHAIARFRQERQILATLSHPNIARLLDGGTTPEGIPYLVMEYIEGHPIQEFCNSRHLDTRSRIRLFLEVCAAVQFAHQHLIVHRDIKPANILVTPEGVPKLLDFGIAKILEPNALPADAPTALTGYLLTPEYASPEQLRAEPITAASDVYSLGIVLYELLTGRSPYPLSIHSPHELGRAVCELEPERPSAVLSRPERPGAQQRAGSPEALSAERDTNPAALRRLLSGDLDHILLKALRKEPRQRYPSVQSLADDLNAYLTGRPVLARRGTTTYRAVKFAVRHKLALTLTTLAACVMIGGVIVVVREGQVARNERQLAERRFDSLRKLTNSLLFEFHDSIENLPGSTAARELVVQRALEYLNQLDAGGRGGPQVRRDLAAAYERIARIEGEELRAHKGGAGAMESSMRLYEKALAIRRELAQANPADPALQLELLAATIKVGTMYWVLGELDRSVQVEQEGLMTAERLAASHDSEELRYQMAGLLTGIAVAQVWLGQYEASLENARRSLTIKERLLAAAPGSARARRQVLITRDWIGTALKFERRFAEAAGQYRIALEEAERLSMSDPNNTDLRRLVAGENESLCKTLAYAGAFAEAPEHCRRAIATAEMMANADPSNVQGNADLASAELSATIAHYLMRQPLAARDFAQRADRTYQQVRLQDPDSLNDLIDHGMTLLFLGRIEAGAGQEAEARSTMLRARELFAQTVARAPRDRYFRDSLAEAEAAINALPRDVAAVGVH